MSEQSDRAAPGDTSPPSSTSGRKHERFAVEAEITLESEHNFYAGFLENLSVSGIFVATYAPRRLGERIEFSIRLGDTETPVSGTAEVRWIRQFSETSDTPPGMGLRFVELAEEAQQRIKEFLKARNPLFFDDEDW